MLEENTEPQAVAPEGEKPEVEPSRKALVDEWIGKVVKARKAYDEHQFKQMRENIKFAKRGADQDWLDNKKYVVPILNRHINQSVSQLYAKNPKAVAKRKRRLNSTLWDGRQDSLQSAMEMAAMGDPAGMQIVQEVVAVQQQNQMLDKMAKTLEILHEYYMDEQAANYKQQLKAVVRRAKVCKVGYIKLGFQRIMEPNPEVTAEIGDITSKIAALEQLSASLAEGEEFEESARLEELRLSMADMQQQETLVVREGPVLDFPRAWEVIPDPACRHLKSFSGCRWVAHDMGMMTPERVMQVYKVDLKDSFTKFYETGEKEKTALAKDDEHRQVYAKVYEIWDKQNRQVLTVCEGYCDFLREPATPKVNLERFWPFFAVVFNETEDDKDPFPPSDIELARDIQNEYNRSREGLREHRIASRPYYVASRRVEEETLQKLANHAAHEVITVPEIATGEKAEDFIQRGPTAPIDPNLYEVEMHFTDLLRTVGTQEANLGGTSGGTATESSIAESSRSVSLADNVDDLDEVLSELARAMGHLMLIELEKETVMEIVGEGAVWPDVPLGREEIAKDLMLEIKAGSSGRPNRASDLANMERGMPFMLQLPGLNPEPIAKRYLDLLDIDLEDAISSGMPSITALNALVSRAGQGGPGGQPTGDPATDPASQGDQGAQNAPNPAETEPGPQAGYPSPAF